MYIFCSIDCSIYQILSRRALILLAFLQCWSNERSTTKNKLHIYIQMFLESLLLPPSMMRNNYAGMFLSARNKLHGDAFAWRSTNLSGKIRNASSSCVIIRLKAVVGFSKPPRSFASRPVGVRVRIGPQYLCLS